MGVFGYIWVYLGIFENFGNFGKFEFLKFRKKSKIDYSGSNQNCVKTNTDATFIMAQRP